MGKGKGEGKEMGLELEPLHSGFTVSRGVGSWGSLRRIIASIASNTWRHSLSNASVEFIH